MVNHIFLYFVLPIIAGYCAGAALAFVRLKAFPIRRMLTEDDFGHLVRGAVVDKNGVKFVLKDIGWDRMYFHIERAMRDAGKDDDR